MHDQLEQELEAAKCEIERLRYDCAEAYQVMGSILIGEPVKYSELDAQRALDNILAAANGEPRPHDDLLPWPRLERVA